MAAPTHLPTGPTGAPAPVGPVVLSFTALPEHVRTARLVATTVARRAGLERADVEGVRQAVGEACGRAVQRSESAGTELAVAVTLTASGGALVIEVVDGAGDDGVESEEVAMLLMEGLADEVAVSAGPGGPGGTARLSWGLPDAGPAGGADGGSRPSSTR